MGYRPRARTDGCLMGAAKVDTPERRLAVVADQSLTRCSSETVLR